MTPLLPTRRRTLRVGLPVLALALAAVCPGCALQPFDRLLDSGWFLRSSAGLSAGGERVSCPGFPADGWLPAVVPGSVLATLVRNGLYGDLYSGRNLERVPREDFRVSWWYRSEFTLDGPDPGSSTRLLFDGINYRADVWLNGRRASAAGGLRGPFRRFDLEVTGLLRRGKNVLAVEVFPPEPGDLGIGFADWNPPPPDGGMGLWRGVRLRRSGPVSLEDPWVRTDLDPADPTRARIAVGVELGNRTDRVQQGVVEGTIEHRRFRRSFSLSPGQRRRVDFHLEIEQPRLWWPNGLGSAELYELSLLVRCGTPGGGRLSDREVVSFGIRTVEDYLSAEGHRGYRVNGREVRIRGAGWTDDLLLVEDGRRLEAQLRYARLMNLNALRLEGFWGGSRELYRLADRYGILLLAGWSCQWEVEAWLGGPVDRYGGVRTEEQMDLAVRSLGDQVRWLRNHPAILAWVLGSDRLPRPELERRYRRLLAELDPSRPVLAACTGTVSEVSGPTGVKMRGPYDYVTPNYWYEDTDRGGAFGFATEIGPGPQPPPFESLRRMIPPEHLWPVDPVWEFHCALRTFGTLDRYRAALEARYGPARDAREFSRKAQVVNFEAARAMFEAYAVHRDRATGLIHWMLNSAWPSFHWQLFDHYLMPNGAFFGVQAGARPVGLVYHYGDRGIYLVNGGESRLEALTVDLRVFDLASEEVFRTRLPAGAEAGSSRKLFELPREAGWGPVFFLHLELRDSRGRRVADNFYWLSSREDVLEPQAARWTATPNREYADFTALQNLPEAAVKADCRWHRRGQEMEAEITLENPTPRIAFFVELVFLDPDTGTPVLPAFWEANYVSLLPGERRTVRARVAEWDPGGGPPELRLAGWNVRGWTESLISHARS